MATYKGQNFETNSGRSSATRINQYSAGRVPTGRVPRPNLPDSSVDIASKVVRVSNKILDAKAEREGLQAGFEAIEQGTQTIDQAEATPMTIRGDAFKKGARDAFVAKTKNELEIELTKLYSDTTINTDPEAFALKTQELRDKIADSTPSSLAPKLLPVVDDAINHYNNKTLALSIATEDANNTATLKDRLFTIIIPRIQENILKGNRVDSDLGESLGILESLRDQNKISQEEFLQNKNILFSSVVEPFIRQKFESAEDKADFLEKFKNNENTAEIMADLYEQYGDEFENAVGEDTFPKTLDIDSYDKLANILEKELNTKIKGLRTERTVYENGFSTKIDEAIKNGDRLENVIDLNDFENELDSLLYSEEDKEALYALYKEGVIVTEYTQNLSSITMNAIEGRIQAVDDKLKLIAGDDQVDADTNIQLMALNKAKGYLVAKQSELLTAYNGGNIYGYLKVNDVETYDTTIDELFQKNIFELTEADLIKRRELAALQLGIDNVEGMPLLDETEITQVKESLTQATTAKELTSAINLINQMDLPANIYLEMDLPAELESLFILSGGGASTSFKFAAEAYLGKEDNLKAANISKKDANTVANDFLSDDKFIGITADVTTKNAMVDVYASFYAKALTTTEGDTEAAERIAKNHFDKAFRIEEVEWNGQNVLIPNNISTADFNKTLEDAEEILNNPLKYGIMLSENAGITDFDLAENTIIIRQGDKLLFQIANKNDLTANDDGNLTYYQIQSNGKNGKAPTETLAINIDPNKRVVAPKDIENNPAWSVIVETDKQAPELSKNQNTFENYYIDIAKQGGYEIGVVEKFATNIDPTDGDKQLILTGIGVKLNNGSISQDEFNWLNTNYPEVFDGLMIPEVQAEVQLLYSVFKENGGYSTLRTGKKLSPLATLYIVHQEAYVKYLEGELATLKESTGEATNIFDANPDKEGTQIFNFDSSTNQQSKKNKIKELEKELDQES
tara:strand:+ start:1536 stop:4454 length:2919 start_codon:yes stop_codon:yes gene_type:complete